jgi:hypothetical protein
LKQKELKEINSFLSEYDSVLSDDALCLEPSDEVTLEVQSNHVSSGDLSTIGLVPMDHHSLIENHPVDTVAFIPGTDDEAPAILLPIPILPRIPDGPYFELRIITLDACQGSKVSHFWLLRTLVQLTSSNSIFNHSVI